MDFAAKLSFYFLLTSLYLISNVKMEGNNERTFIMVKPDGVQRGLVGKIIQRFEERGFKLVALTMTWAHEELLKNHYADLTSTTFFPNLISYMSSGPVVPMIWEGLDAVNSGRSMIGATNPKNANPGTIRGTYCLHIGRNIIHGSDSVEKAKKEIEMWFGNRGENKTLEWTSWEEKWIYE